MSDIETDLVDLAPGDQLVQLLNHLQENQAKSDARSALQLRDTLTAEEFFQKVDNLQDYYNEVTWLLQKNQLDNNLYVWIFSLESLVKHLIKYKVFYDRQLINNFQYDINGNSIVEAAGTKLGKLCGDLGEFTHTFCSSNMSFAKIFEVGKASNFVFNKFASVVVKSLEVLIIDKSEDAQYIDNGSFTIGCLSNLIYKLYDYVYDTDSTKRNKLLYKAFPILTELIKVSYIAGEVQLIEKFLDDETYNPPVIDYRFPFEVIKNSTVDLSTLIDFYKFTAFNLVTLSLQGPVIKKTQLDRAKFYFKILFSFPNLKTSLYRQSEVTNKLEVESQLEEDRLISLNERQEISLMYILFYLLNLENLNDLTNPDTHFNNQVQFLIVSLSSSISWDLDNSASHSGSHSSSLASLHQPLSTKPQVPSRRKQYNRIKFKSLSSIIVYGSYKENLTLVVNFLKHFKPNRLDVPVIVSNHALRPEDGANENEFQHSISNIDPQRYPGKIFYVETIDKIVQILKVLTVKHLVDTGGFNYIHKNTLDQIFTCKNSILEACKVKDILSVTPDNSNQDILYFDTSPRVTSLDDEKFVEKQLDSIALTKELQVVASRLNSLGNAF